MTLKIGKTDTGHAFMLPPEALTQTFALLARRGAGKTNTAVVMAEEFLSANRFIVAIDPVGVWWGLRSSYDGKSAGYSVLVMGGEHGDVPLDSRSGSKVAEFLVKERVPTILDVSLFGEGEMRRFVGEFAADFYRLNREAVHVFIDEADEFAPQSGYGAESAKCLGAMQNLIRRGRARGIGVTLITQRSAVINKSVLNMTECLLALQMTAPQDIKAIDGWLQYHSSEKERDRILRSLPSFQVGQAWVYSPGWLGSLTQIQVRRRETFDSSATPKPGEERKQPKTLAEIDLKKLSNQMKNAVEQAKANDPKELRKEISELKRNSANYSKSPDPQAVARAIAERDRFWKKRETELLATIKRHAITADRVRKTLEEIRSENETALAAPPPTIVSRPNVAPPIGKPLTIQYSENNGEIGKGGLRRMMIALAQRPQGMNARQLGVRAGLSSNSGTFGTYLGRARECGWILGSRENLQITEQGLKELGNYDPLPTGPDLLAYWLRELGNSGAARILHTLGESYPKPISKEELGNRSGMSATSGTFGTYLGKLRSLELIEGKGELVMSEELA